MAMFRKTFTRYLNADGTRTRKGEPGARKKRERSKDWYGRYRDADGIERTKRLATNKTAATQLLNELVKQSELGQAGVVDPFAEHAKRPLAVHLTDFRRHLEAKESTASYVRLTVTRIEAMVTGCGFKRLSDLSASRVADWLAEQREADVFGIATSNHYLSGVKGFTHWLVKDRRMPDDRLSHLPRLKADADRRIEHRHLSPADLGQFIAATRENGTRYGLSGESRGMLYLTAAYTGLRASELASLTSASFDLDVDPAIVTVQAAFSKHRKRDELPLHPDLVTRLRQWLSATRETTDGGPDVIRIDRASEATDGPLWPGRWAMDRRGWRMVKADLAAAGIPYRDEQGRQFDFHALRHQFISMLAAAGVHPKTAQELARHSTITLTMDHYTHLRVSDLSSALSTLPPLTPAREAHAATGTNDARAVASGGGEPLVARMVTRVADIPCDSVTSVETTGGESDVPEEASTPKKKTLRLQGFEDDCVRLSSVEKSADARVSNGTRTRDLRNHNPAL